MIIRLLFGAFLCAVFLSPEVRAQFNQIETDRMRLVYYGEAHAYLVRHAARTFENALTFQRSLYDYEPDEKVTVLLHDLYDYGNAGAGTAPRNMVAMAIAPLSYVFETAPGSERIYATMNHELVHIVTNDQSAGSDRVFRALFRGKILETEENPLSAVYSYLAAPRRSSPRWYREGIAVFLETWMTGGQGRALGGYDEMVFRAMVADGRPFYDHVGLEAEGTQIDFQVGVNAYLYGTRFMTHLALTYGPERVIEWTRRGQGSRAYFATQFREVFGLPLGEAWQQWIDFERDWQLENLASVRANPITPFRPITRRAVGSASRAHYDPESNSIFVAVNYPGQVAHIARIHLDSGRMEQLAEIKGASLFDVCSLAYDPDAGVLFYTTDNNSWRDLRAYNLTTGSTRTLLDDARIGDLAFNRADRSIWGVRHFNGISTIAHIPHPYERWIQVYSWPFGRDLYDIDISPDGKYLIGSLAEVSGRQSLIRMPIDSLLAGRHDYETLFDFDRSIPSNFTFSADGRYLYGSSYYTGVSNIFRYDLEKGRMEVMSNDEIGLFRPFPISDDSVFVYRYSSQGFVPGLIPNRPASKVTAIRFLGQELVERRPIVREWIVPPPSTVDLEALTQGPKPYHGLQAFGVESLYPVVEGYKTTAAFGLRLDLSSPLRLHRASITAAYSPASEADERFHIKGAYHYRSFSLEGGYNATDFYDLFGPTRSTRKGYAVQASHLKTFINDPPRSLELSTMVGAFGGFEALPDYQNVAATFDEMQTARVGLRYQNYRASLGAVDYEKGFGWSLNASSNLVNGHAYPRVFVTADQGFLLGGHVSTWIRASAGASFGDRDNPFANFYFGDFGNNWVDRGNVKRFRSYASFPGVELNEIGGTRFVRGLNEWILPPLRFRRVGGSGLYLKWLRPALFTSILVANPDSDEWRSIHSNVGAQLDLRLVVFSHLSSTLSAGYAVAFGDVRGDGWMVSLQLL